MINQIKKPAKLAGGTEKIPAPKVRQIGKGIGVYEKPVHIEEGPTRLPDKIEEYAVSAYPGGRPLTRQEIHVQDLHSRGLTPVRIAVGTGIRLGAVYSILGLDTDTKQFEKDRDELAELRKV